jgi:hypothetical protein
VGSVKLVDLERALGKSESRAGEESEGDNAVMITSQDAQKTLAPFTSIVTAFPDDVQVKEKKPQVAAFVANRIRQLSRGPRQVRGGGGGVASHFASLGASRLVGAPPVSPLLIPATTHAGKWP